MIRMLGLAVLTALVLGASAQAETLPPYPPAAKAPNLSTPLNMNRIGPIELRYASARPPLPRGVARTAIEHRDGAISGGVGVLCGIQPSADNSGVGTARGYDNEGRFVGAKLGFSF